MTEMTELYQASETFWDVLLLSKTSVNSLITKTALFLTEGLRSKNVIVKKVLNKLWSEPWIDVL